MGRIAFCVLRGWKNLKVVCVGLVVGEKTLSLYDALCGIFKKKTREISKFF